MPNDRIKVAGYAQKIFYDNQIQYRNFSPDLVGTQLASNGGTPLFTMGNFAITTNFDPKKTKTFITSKFSNFVSLTDLDLTLQATLDLLVNNAGVVLNLDKSNLINYALFGSLREYTRVALENIITNWPAALYVNPEYILTPSYTTYSGYTVENYSYDSVNNVSYFSVNTNVINNQYGINFISTNLNAQTNDLRNLNLNYASYSILKDNIEYDVIGFTGTPTTLSSYIYFSTKGDVFSGITNGYPVYYVKPNTVKENSFYNSLDVFENYLLNRLVVPKFTALFNFTIKTDGGGVLYVNESITWPSTDGYNIDFSTDAYADYATKLLEITDQFDLTTSNLMIRFLVTESITSFDTAPVHLAPLDEDTSGQKMNKTLNIYGVEFDKINAFIKGIKFANTVSYNKQNNTPDIYLKNIARILGWDLISSVIENNLLKSYLIPNESTYSGQSVGLTAVEADTELWRRIILNTPWLWKSKGTRKSIEFLFKFIGTPLGLISFNEYVYLAENRIDVDIFKDALILNGRDPDISKYPISLSGYPLPLPNTPDMYFQGNGLWYRETGGDNATIDITSGNNPHAGPYDGGYKYINQFRELIPNFSSVTISSETSTTNTKNIFTNYKSGTMTQYSGNTYIDISTEEGVDFSNCYLVTTSIIEDPKHRQDETDCGCDILENLKSLSICIDKKDPVPYNCNDDIASITEQLPIGYYNYNYKQYNIDGTLYTVNGSPVYNTSKFVNKNCCKTNGVQSYYFDDYSFDNTQTLTLKNSGYICCNKNNNTCGCYVTCKWKLAEQKTINYPTNGDKYLLFAKPNGLTGITSQDGCHCIADLTIPVAISASTTDVGVGCKLTQLGLADITSQDSIIVQTYIKRVNGEIGCNSVYVPEVHPKIFAVVINSDNQIGSRINNLRYVDKTYTQSLIFNNYNNTDTLLSGNTSTLLNSGYYYGLLANQFKTPYYGDTVRMLIDKNPQDNGVDLVFNPILGNHKMSYLISNVEYTNETFLTQGLAQAIPLVANEDIVSGQEVYYADFNYTASGTSRFIYLVWDFSPADTGIKNWLLRSNSTIPSTQPVQLLYGSGGTPTMALYNGTFQNNVSGVDLRIRGNNGIVILNLPNRIIQQATCNGVTVSPNTSSVTWRNVTGPITVTYTSN